MSDPYTTYHSYDIKEMLFKYQISELDIDDTLAIFIAIKMMSLYERDRGRTSRETQLHAYLNEIINLYNNNKNTISDSDKQKLGTIQGY